MDWDICRKSQQGGWSKNSIQHKNRDICIFKNGNEIERGLSNFSNVHERDFCRSHTQGVLTFIDDIVICSEKWEQHFKLVNKVLKRLAEHNLEAKVGKWHFREKEIKCVGFVVSFKCRKPDPDKVRAMKELQPHKTKEDVRSVLGLVAFYYEFIRNMSGLTALIQKLMEKNFLFEWNTEQQKWSETLKNRISDKLCLTFPEPD